MLERGVAPLTSKGETMDNSSNKNIDRGLKCRAVRNRIKKYSIIIPLIIYILLNVAITKTVVSTGSISIGSAEFPVSALAGILSYVVNILQIVFVVFYKKPGFILSLALLIVQFPTILARVIMQHNYVSLQGVFSCVFTAIFIIVLYQRQVKTDQEHQRTRDLFEQTVTALVSSIDAKDKYTHGHSTRVADYSRRIAELSFKSEKECDEIYYSALLHDVGKIGIPEDIINKETDLTPDEWDIIKQHPVLGAQILQSISEFPYLSIGAEGHHERYDGKGYPYGLKGTDIPDIARIVSVADAYDTMSSKRSYRDPIPQQIVREEIVKGIGEQFDPHYARLMLHLIDIDTEYEMCERAEGRELSGKKELVVGRYRSELSQGILITPNMTTVHLTVTPDGKLPGRGSAAMVLFDSLDGRVHTSENEVKALNYFEYGEVWFDGRTSASGARKMQTNTAKHGAEGLEKPDAYIIEAVKYKDHALIRIISKTQTNEIKVALPDSTRYLYISFTGEHCRISDVSTEKAHTQIDAGYIPRIAEEISYINEPEGDMPNVQIDGYRTAASKGVEIKDGLQISFHTKNLPTSRLVWHCPFIDMFCSDDGTVGGKNYRDLAFMRFDGEFWESDKCCVTEIRSHKNDKFKGWEAWKQYNRDGYNATVAFMVEGNRITMITENAGISIRAHAEVKDISKPIYAAVSGDQVAITNIRVGKLFGSEKHSPV